MGSWSGRNRDTLRFSGTNGSGTRRGACEPLSPTTSVVYAAPAAVATPVAVGPLSYRYTPHVVPVALIIPALDEEHAIGALLASIDRTLVRDVIVGDNGSRDATGAVAARAGAT